MPFIWKPATKPEKEGANGRTFVICNPHSNRDRHRPLIPKEIKALEEAEIDFIYAITENPMDEYHMAVEAIQDGFDTVVASGGDSTVSNIADAILTNRPETRFGILPMGTGNDFATGNGIPRSITQAVKIVKRGHTEKRDVIKIGDRFAVSLVGFGFDITMSEIHLSNTILKGQMLYFWSIIQAIFRHRGNFVRVETDTGEVIEGKSMMLNLGNNRISGGGYPTCPKADMTDGKLDVMFIDECGPGTRLHLFQLVQKAKHLAHPLVHYTQAASVTVTCEAPLAFHTEGELFYTEKKELTAHVIPGRLDLIVPAPE